MTLKESLALANEVGVKVDVTKQYIIDYLTERYSNEVVCNGRINYTKTGLPLADTHYAVSNGEKSKCFVYVYETDVATMLLVRLSDEAAALLKKKGIALRKSAFPKSREEGFTWYSLIPDDNCPASDVQEVLNTAYALAK